MLMVKTVSPKAKRNPSKRNILKDTFSPKLKKKTRISDLKSAISFPDLLAGVDSDHIKTVNTKHRGVSTKTLKKENQVLLNLVQDFMGLLANSNKAKEVLQCTIYNPIRW